MHIDRLRFAQARGACIESQRYWSMSNKKTWGSANWLPLTKEDRICARDKHLAYGPLSTALIDSLMFKTKDYRYIPELEAALRWLEVVCWQGNTQEDLDRSSIVYSFTEDEGDLCHLFFAEYLADMGL